MCVSSLSVRCSADQAEQSIGSLAVSAGVALIDQLGDSLVCEEACLLGFVALHFCLRDLVDQRVVSSGKAENSAEEDVERIHRSTCLPIARSMICIASLWVTWGSSCQFAIASIRRS